MIVAHGIGGRSDLPLPVWLFAYGAGFAVLVSFVALGVFWKRPLLAAAARGRLLGRPPRAAVAAARAVGLIVFAVVLSASLLGVDDGGANLAPYALYVAFWVGLQLLSAFAGDVWRALNPLATIGLLLPDRPDDGRRPDPGLWPAAAMVGSFAWLELSYHASDSPRAIGVWLLAYTAAALAGGVLWGRRWLVEGEGFAALFTLLAAMAPLHREEETGRLRLRWPVAGLATVRPRPGIDALILVVLGATTFDGVTRLDRWTADIVGARQGWDRTLVHTLGLLFIIGLVATVWQLATRWSARITGDDPAEVADAYVASLVPIVLAYAIAHYFSLFVYEMYNVVALASDPYGKGWDLFGTIDVYPDYRDLSTSLIAWVQAGAIVAGHVAGVATAHDRAVERHPAGRLATRSQWPLVAAMVGYTVAGLGLLLGA